MEGQEEAEEEPAEEECMTEDMQRGGGVASTSWMIWMVWGWQR